MFLATCRNSPLMFSPASHKSDDYVDNQKKTWRVPSRTAPILLIATLTPPPTSWRSFPMLVTPSLTPCVARRPCAVAIRVSSCVSFSNLRNASLISDLPTKNFRNLSEERISQKKWHIIQHELTYFSLFNLPCYEGKDEKHLDHNFHYNIGHFCCRREFDICPKSYEEILDTFKEVDKCTLAGAGGKNRLGIWASKEYKENRGITHREKGSNARKDHPRRRVCLEN